MSHMHTRFNNASLLAEGERVSDEQLVEEAKILSLQNSMKMLSTRRSFFRNVAVGAAAVGSLGAVGALAGCSDDGAIATTATTPSVFDVLNFALNLEYLEASFYLYVTTGAGLTSTQMGTGAGTVTGGAKVTFTNAIVTSLANQLAQHESEHVTFLRASITALGGTPVAMPNINLAAGGTVSGDATFLAISRQLEAVGVSAYAGGAQYLTSNTTALLYAAQILDVEAQHAGFLRTLCIQLGVGSSPVDSQDLQPAYGAIFNTSPTTGLNPVRTTSQVLQIVYAAANRTGVSQGGFFPGGLNGTIRTS